MDNTLRSEEFTHICKVVQDCDLPDDFTVPQLSEIVLTVLRHSLALNT